MKPLSKAERWKKEQVLSKKEIDYLRRPYSPATICDREQRAIRDRLLATIEARDERIKELEAEIARRDNIGLNTRISRCRDNQEVKP